jgi:hypothetical protein
VLDFFCWASEKSNMMMTVLAAALGALLSPSPISKHPSRPFGDPLELQRLRSTDSAFASPNSLAAAAAGVAALIAAQPEPAFAKGGEYGIFEGRIASMAHPAVSEWLPPLACAATPTTAAVHCN